jgi:hypothetical protein
VVWCHVENVASSCIPDKISAHAFPVLKNAVIAGCVTVGLVEIDSCVAASVGHRCVGDRFRHAATDVRPLLWVTAVWVTAYVLEAAASAKSRPWWWYVVDVWVAAAVEVTTLCVCD